VNSRGLFLTAEKQFLSYKQPTKSYSSSIIASNLIDGNVTTIEIGDMIKLCHPQLNLQINKGAFDIWLSTEPDSDQHISIITNSDLKTVAATEKILSRDQSCIKVAYSQIDNQYIYNLSDIKAVAIGSKIYSWNGFNRILYIQQAKQSEEIELRITGITKKLREDVAQLTIEENTLYNSLVDRLIKILR
jgi:hypothetical protein